MPIMKSKFVINS